MKACAETTEEIKMKINEMNEKKWSLEEQMDEPK